MNEEDRNYWKQVKEYTNLTERMEAHTKWLLACPAKRIEADPETFAIDLKDGEEVWIRWNGGNGPWKYTVVAKPGRPLVAKECGCVIDFVGTGQWHTWVWRAADVGDVPWEDHFDDTGRVEDDERKEGEASEEGDLPGPIPSAARPGAVPQRCDTEHRRETDIPEDQEGNQ